MKIKNLLSLDSNRISDVATPTSDNDAANKAYVDAAMPTGTMVQYIADTAPTGWMLCDGAAVSRSTYSALYALIGTTYGAGNGSTTFNVPDLRGRVPMGSGTGAGDGSSGTGAPSGTALTLRSRGAWGGGETHTLTTAQLASHSHTSGTLTIPTHTHSFTPSGTVSSHSHTFYVNRLTNTADANGARVRLTDANADGSGMANGTSVTTATSTPTFTGSAGNTGSAVSANAVAGASGSEGSGSAHNNIQPFMVVSYIIKI